MCSQRVRHDWATELNWTELLQVLCKCFSVFSWLYSHVHSSLWAKGSYLHKWPWILILSLNILHVLYAYIFIFWLPSIIWIYPSRLHKTLGSSVKRTQLQSIPHENSLQGDRTLVTHSLDCRPFLHLFPRFVRFCECVYLPIMVHTHCLFINEQVSGLMHTLGDTFSPVDMCALVFSNFLDLKCGFNTKILITTLTADLNSGKSLNDSGKYFFHQ